jgi:hypothetical protein
VREKYTHSPAGSEQGISFLQSRVGRRQRRGRSIGGFAD